MRKSIFIGTADVIDHLKKDYPNLCSVPVCAFGCIYAFYEDDTMANKVAETLYYPKESEGTHCYKHYLVRTQQKKTA